MSIFLKTKGCRWCAYRGYLSTGNHYSKGRARTALIGLVAAWIWALPCVAFSQFPSESAAATTEAAAVTLHAEPIAPLTYRKLPHLKPYQGHILLGTARVHVVLAGVPPQPAPSDWQPGVLAVFELRHGAWVAKTAVAGIDLRNTGVSTPMVATAVDLGIDRQAKAAFATYVYSTSSQKNLRQVVSYRLDDEIDRLAVIFDAFSLGESVAVTSKWRLRLGGRAAMLAPSREQDWGGIQGLVHLVRYRGADVAGFLMYRPFVLRKDGGWLELEPRYASKERLPLEGYEVYLTRAATATLLRRVEDMRACFYEAFRPSTLPKPEARASWALACGTDAPRTLLRLRLAGDDAGGASVPYPVHVFTGEGEAVQYTSLYAGETIDLDLPSATALQLADTATGRVIEGVGPLTLTAGEARPLELPERVSGRVWLVNKATPGLPALLKVRRLDAPAGEAGVIQVSVGGQPVTPVASSSGIWLANAWPVELELLPGGYEVAMARGGTGHFCAQKVVAVSAQAHSYLCDDEGTLTREPSFADLGLHLSAERVKPDARVLQAALNVRWLTVDAVRMAKGDSSPSSVTMPDLTLVPAIRVVDEATGVDLQLLPASPALVKRWALFRPREPQDLLPALARLAREEGDGTILELGCPGPGISTLEYARLMERLKPDALRLFGCESDLEGVDRATQDAWFELWVKQAGTRAKPYVLTAASSLRVAEESPRFARLLVPPGKADANPLATLLGALQRREVSVSVKNAHIAIEALRRMAAVGSPGRFDAALTMNVRLPQGMAGELIVSSEQGVLVRQGFAAGSLAAPMNEVSVTYPWPQGPNAPRRLRAELRAGDAGALVAATNFHEIDELLRSTGVPTP